MLFIGAFSGGAISALTLQVKSRQQHRVLPNQLILLDPNCCECHNYIHEFCNAADLQF